MKELKCEICKREMGEMEKGKSRHGAIILCKECWLTSDRLLNLSKFTEQADLPDIFKDLLGGFKR